MADFETHPVGTADLLKRLRSGKNGQEIEAADRIEQLEAELGRLSSINTKLCADFNTLNTDGARLEAALTRANAATAAAYEVAARIADRYAEYNYCAMNYPEDAGMAASSTSHEIRCEIRALATPDQTAALDRLIAEAVGPYLEALIWCSGSADFGDGGFARVGWLKLCEPLILAASKKGGM